MDFQLEILKNIYYNKTLYTIRSCSKSFLRDIEIKNKFIRIAINLFKQYI